ncbi:aldo-keto reductase [Choiromyces venosus 120613-1]|uniref:Aldo-keto reductase n=1 Tax=Choiromyces venosus 120613-1 TaxID=1336337 RepID=A0A3N4K5D4_9PEZI|nr:aldo-keto reductase [Choiromyces venosus 120613-1]
MAPNSPTSTYKLASGHEIPVIGFGVYQMPPGITKETVLKALHSGYRHIDTAKLYRNEAECGAAIRQFMKETGTPRSDIYYTTKIWLDDLRGGYDTTKMAIKKQLDLANIEYIDLFLIHAPLASSKDRAGAWKALEEAVEEGKVRSLGVSNYGIHHLKQLLDSHPKVKPSVGQYELHPWLVHQDIIDFGVENGIVMEAYSPLAKGLRLNDALLKPLVQKYSKSSAQILLRWSIQKGLVPLVKSSTESRLKENLEIFDFELEDGDMKKLTTDEYFVTGWDPTTAGLEGN